MLARRLATSGLLSGSTLAAARTSRRAKLNTNSAFPPGVRPEHRIRFKPQLRQYSIGEEKKLNAKDEREREEAAEKEAKVLPIAEKARALVEMRKSATFTTVSLDYENSSTPLFGSLMPYVLLHRFPGSPIIAIRNDERHAKHIEKVSKCSMTFFPLTPKNSKPSEMPLPKLNITGQVSAILEEDDIRVVLDRFETVHPGSGQFLRQRDIFEFFEFKPDDVFFQKSSGTVIQLAANEYLKAPVDPIAPHAREIIEYMNNKYPEELRLMCKEYGDVDVVEVFMMSCDRRGFDMFGKLDSGAWLEFRLPFDRELLTPKEFREQLESSASSVKALVGNSKT